jgi:hypothetical protein
VAGPACQRPTPAHGRVSRPAHAHARMETLQWLGARPPPCVGAVDRPSPPLHAQPMQPPPPRACHALIPRSGHTETCSPPLPRQPPSFRLTLLCLSPRSSVPSAEQCRWEPLLPPHAPLCRYRLGVRSPNRPPLRADWTPPLTSFPSDQAAPPAAKDLRDVSLHRSSSGLISALLSIAQTPDSSPTSEPAPSTSSPANRRRFPINRKHHRGQPW